MAKNLSVDYEVTLTLLPKLYKHDQDVQLSKTCNFWKSFGPYTKKTFVAELTQQNNVHYHGIISVPVGPESHTGDPKRFIVNTLRGFSNFFGKRTISQVMNYAAWTGYMKKGPYQVLVDEYNLFNSPSEGQVDSSESECESASEGDPPSECDGCVVCT